MKNIYKLFLSFAAAGTLLTSCLKDEEETIQSSPECVITDFNIGDISTDVTVKLANGKDTVITKVIGGSGVSFNIDQVNNRIYSVDSLPMWANITNVVPTLSTTGYVYVKEYTDTDFRAFASGSDSLDFTQPVKLLVVATDGVSKKEYTAQIFKKESETDSLDWKIVDGANLQLEGKHRSLTFQDRIYVFYDNGGVPTVTSSSFLSNGASWRNPAPMNCNEAAMDWSSVVAFGDKLYALNENGNICQSTNEERGETWTVVSDRIFKRLLAADGNYIYACDEDCIWGSTDLQNWNDCGSNDMDMLPESYITAVSYPSRTNPFMKTVVMGGLTEQNSDNAVIWHKVSSADPSIDQSWNYIQVTDENSYGCPKLENLSMAHHKSEIFAIGGNNEGIYISEDNGITWHMQTSKKMLPAEVVGQSAVTSITSGNGYLWLIQSGGKVWKGKIG